MPNQSKKSSERSSPSNDKQSADTQSKNDKNVDQREKPLQDDNPHAADTQSEFAHADVLRDRED